MPRVLCGAMAYQMCHAIPGVSGMPGVLCHDRCVILYHVCYTILGMLSNARCIRHARCVMPCLVYQACHVCYTRCVI